MGRAAVQEHQRRQSQHLHHPQPPPLGPHSSKELHLEPSAHLRCISLRGTYPEPPVKRLHPAALVNRAADHQKKLRLPRFRRVQRGGPHELPHSAGARYAQPAVLLQGVVGAPGGGSLFGGGGVEGE